MRRFTIKYDDLKNVNEVLYIGTGREIKRVYDGLIRTKKAINGLPYEPSFKFINKRYGLTVYYTSDAQYPTMYVLNADLALTMLLLENSEGFCAVDFAKGKGEKNGKKGKER